MPYWYPIGQVGPNHPRVSGVGIGPAAHKRGQSAIESAQHDQATMMQSMMANKENMRSVFVLLGEEGLAGQKGGSQKIDFDMLEYHPKVLLPLTEVAL